MNEIIIEGLTEEDIKLIHTIVCKHPITVEDFNSVIRIKELNDKLSQILTYFND